MNRSGAYQAGANAATAGNALLGVGAIAYTLAGNKLFAMLLIVGAIGFDGLDGWLHRRGGGPATLLGRVLDSSADAVSFGVAPGVLIAVHTFAHAAYAPYATVAVLVGFEVSALAIARLLYFTARSYAHPFFLGASTPQTALALIGAVLFFDQPGYLGAWPAGLLVTAAVLAPLMVLPIPFPKIRRGARLRGWMTGTSLALAVGLILIQFAPARGSPLFIVTEVASAIAVAGIAVYYLVGPWSARRDTERLAPEGVSHG
jgi:CDP-diacylglycerol--serine O-phosphatidyltransferase